MERGRRERSSRESEAELEEKQNKTIIIIINTSGTKSPNYSGADFLFLTINKV